MNYETLLKNAPPHDSPKFIDYLRANNVVVLENDWWLVIENFKYHHKGQPWYTAFAKWENPNFSSLFERWADWTWLKKPAEEQTVKRFHIHIYQSKQ